MLEAIADTGPCLHLSEIECLTCLSIFDRLIIPAKVEKELEAYRVDVGLIGNTVERVEIPPDTWQPIAEATRLQEADAQVLALARRADFSLPVLTDDLALRRCIENEDGEVAGSLGVLVRSYRLQALECEFLIDAVDRLMTKSTLHMSRAFRAWVHGMLEDLLLSSPASR